MKYLQKLNLLYEEILKSTFTVDTFKFNFESDDSGELICKFDTVNKDDKLIQVIAHISTDRNY